MFYEIKKIKSNRIYKIGIAILFIIISISCYATYKSYTYIQSLNSEQYYKGISAIRKIKEDYSQISGKLTIEKLNKAIKMYRNNGGNFEAEFMVDKKYPRVIQLLEDAYGNFDESSEKIVGKKDANDFYKRRNIVITSYLRKNNVGENEIKKVNELVNKTEFPFEYNFVKQWSDIWKSCYVVYLYLIIFILILSSLMFSVEKDSEMNGILTNIKNKKKMMISRNKIKGIYYITSKLYIISFLMISLVLILLLGMDGLNSPIQIRYFFSTYDFTFMQAMIIYFFMGWVSILAISSIGCLIYLLVNKSILSIIISIILVVSPLMLQKINSFGLFGKIMHAQPINGINMVSMLKYPGLYNVAGVYISNISMVIILGIFVVILAYTIIPKLFNKSLNT